MQERTCSVDGCDKLPRSSRAIWCKMHYHRWYRHGDVEMVARSVSVAVGRRYKMRYAVDHPLAHKNGKVYEHRAVLYAEIGPGPHPCHWCSTPVDWLPKGAPGELQPDHLNNMGDDNRPENLVASCRSCNTKRAQQRRSRILQELGWFSHHDTVGKLGGRMPPMVT